MNVTTGLLIARVQSTVCVVVQLSTVTNVTIYGPNPCRGRAALCSFNVEGLHATDISTLLDQEGEHIQACCCMHCPNH